MITIHGLRDEQLPFERSVLTIGNFDGVHRGHQRIIAVARAHAREESLPAVVLTFEPHPLSVLRPKAPPARLSPPAQKLAYLEDAGADAVVVAESCADLLNMSPAGFVRDVIVDRFQPAHIVEGRNFGFGRGRRGDVETLREMSAVHGFAVHIVEPVQQRLDADEAARVSSSLIRELLAFGKAELAAEALGRPYVFRGRVSEGSRRGRTLGFPTANLTDIEQLVPADGVYAGVTETDGGRYASAVSIGTTPTFEGRQCQVETHLIDFVGDLYGHTVTVHLCRWLRGQRKFASREELAEQITADVDAAREGAP